MVGIETKNILIVCHVSMRSFGVHCMHGKHDDMCVLRVLCVKQSTVHINERRRM